MTSDSLILAAVLAFFGLFGVTLLCVSVWCNLAPAKAPQPRSTQARRPTVADTILDAR